jgi:hypothetical protein
MGKGVTQTRRQASAGGRRTGKLGYAVLSVIETLVWTPGATRDAESRSGGSEKLDRRHRKAKGIVLWFPLCVVFDRVLP